MSVKDKKAGRPRSKPDRSKTSFDMNNTLLERLEKLQERRGQSLNDLYNEAIESLLKKEKL